MQFIKLNDKPFNDDKAKYDFEEHQYRLTFDFIHKKTGINPTIEFKDETNANIELDKIQSAFYDILYDRVNGKDIDKQYRIKEYILAKDTSKRKILLDCLALYIDICIDSDIDRTHYQNKVNFDSGMRIDIKKYDDLPNNLIRKLNRINALYNGEYLFDINETYAEAGY